jgi:hypothetical protein
MAVYVIHKSDITGTCTNENIVQEKSSILWLIGVTNKQKPRKCERVS